MKPDESVVCYINSVFAPGLDEGVGGLFKVCSARIRAISLRKLFGSVSGTIVNTVS